MSKKLQTRRILQSILRDTAIIALFIPIIETVGGKSSQCPQRLSIWTRLC